MMGLTPALWWTVRVLEKRVTELGVGTRFSEVLGFCAFGADTGQGRLRPLWCCFLSSVPEVLYETQSGRRGLGRAVTQ